MKRAWLAVGATSAVAAAAVISTGAMASPPAGHQRVLNFDVRFSPFFLVDFSAHGVSTVTDLRRSRPSEGDQTIFHDRIVKDGRVVGVEAGSCVATRVDPAARIPISLACAVTFGLPGGQITAQGLASNAPVKRLVVTGGTGRFADSSGRVAITEFNSRAGKVVFRLSDDD